MAIYGETSLEVDKELVGNTYTATQSFDGFLDFIENI